MEPGVLELNRILGLGSGGGFGAVSAENQTTMQNWAARSAGSSIQEGSGFCDDTCRTSKLAKTDADFSLYPTALLLGSCGKSISTSALPHSQKNTPTHTKNAGYLCRGLKASADMSLLSGIGGPFTATQWLELEQQALIYKYITTNEPIPAHLLIPIVKAFEAAGLYGLNGGTFMPSQWGWGPFHLGYTNSHDLEPGRCRRTDGKKWRCAKDAVPNQKYCERHMNRGRHRSRKHVEGQGNGQSVSGATKQATAKPLPRSVVASSLAQSALPGGTSSKSYDINNHKHHQVMNLQRSTLNSDMDVSLSRENSGGHTMPDATEFSLLSQGINPKRNEGSFSILPEESALNGFGALSSRSRGSYELKHQDEAELKHSLSTITEERNGNHSGANQLSNWHPRSESQSNSTQLSMSVLTGPADFMSSTSSPTKENPVRSPLGLSQKLEMGLGVGLKTVTHPQGEWTPVSWETSMGGPLGEALNSSGFSNRDGESRKTSAIHLLGKGCDENGSCQLSFASPTGVLQKSSMKSLSYSSSSSSPRADNGKTVVSTGSLGADLLN